MMAATAEPTHGVVLFDARGRVIAIDPALANAQGFRVEELLGRDVNKLPWVDVANALRIQLRDDETLFVGMPKGNSSRPTRSVGLRDALRAATECAQAPCEDASGSVWARARIVTITPELRQLAMSIASVDLASHPSQVQVMDIVTAAIAATRLRRPASTHLTVEVEAAGPPIGEDDAALLEQVLVGVLSNAGEALTERARGFSYPPSIAVRLGFSDGAAWVEIVDSGIGFSDAFKSAVFEAGFTTKDAAAHVGMGLPVARRILMLLGGSIEVRSNAGGPTTARLEWPLLIDADDSSS